MSTSKMQLIKTLGLMFVFTVTATICNAAPPDKAPKSNFTYVINGNTVDFTNTTTDDNDDPATLTYLWEFGDGATDAAQHTSHTYPTDPADITYTVTLSATDSGGRTGASNQSVLIPGGAPTTSTEPVAYLQKACGNEPVCFTASGDLTNWINNVRKPDQQNPLVVNIGPGSFTGFAVICDATTTGFVSFDGSGRGVTVIENPALPLGFGMGFNNCQNIAVQDLTVKGSLAVNWQRGGSSNWTNVEMVGTRAAWYDSIDASGSTCPQSDIGFHNFFATTFRTEDASFGQTQVFFNACGDNWIRGSEIFLRVNAGTANIGNNPNAVISRGAGNQVRIYGSNVRAIIESDGPNTPDGLLTGFNSESGGTIHAHGGEIVVRAVNPANNTNIVALRADGAGSRVHSVEMSYGLLPSGTGTATRIEASNGGNVNAPFQWPSSNLPPTPGDSAGLDHLISDQGQDMYIETDCVPGTVSGSGCDNANTGTQSHLLIYDATCNIGTSGPWLDVVTGQCRGYSFP